MKTAVLAAAGMATGKQSLPHPGGMVAAAGKSGWVRVMAGGGLLPRGGRGCGFWLRVRGVVVQGGCGLPVTPDALWGTSP
jgi:hypothetical protein